MDNRIDNLLNKYWEADSTIAEEKELKAYFNSAHVAPQHEQYKDLFVFFDLSQMTSFQGELKNLDTIEEVKPTVARSFTRFLSPRIMGIAASLLLLISVGVFSFNQSTMASYKGKSTVITEEEEALEMTKEALAYLTKRLNKKTKKIQSSLKELETVDIIK